MAVSAIQVEILQFHLVFVNSSITLAAIEGKTLLDVSKSCKKIADCKLICREDGNLMYSSEVPTIQTDCGDVSSLLECYTKQKGKIVIFQ